MKKDDNGHKCYGLDLSKVRVQYVKVECAGCKCEYNEQAALANDPSHKRFCRKCRKSARSKTWVREYGTGGTGGGYRSSEQRVVG